MQTAHAHRRLDRNPRRRRSSPGRRAALLLLLGGAAACGDRADESQRAELEAQYGPRVVESDTIADTSVSAADPDPVTSGTGAPATEPGPEPATPAEVTPAGEAPTATAPPAPPPPEDTAGDDPRPVAEAGPQEFDVASLLTEAENAYGSLTSLRASFVQVMEVPLLERSSSGTGTWYQKGRNRFRMDFEDPPDDEIVADGTYLWLYHPSQNPEQVIRSELDAEGTDSGTADLLARILAEARTAYDARYDGREPLGGVEMHIVTLTPLGRSPYRSVRIWVGARDRLVRRFQIVEVNESIRTVTLSDLEPNAALADSLFRFTVPSGADVFSG